MSVSAGTRAARQIGATAFDFFGILVPGSILLAAVLMALAMLSGRPLDTDAGDVSGMGVALFMFASYLAGHIAQFAGRYVDRLASVFWPWGRVFRMSVDSADDRMTEDLLDQTRQRLEARLGVALGKASDTEISNLTDEFMDLYGSGDLIHGFRSREVYFRGVLTALTGMALVLFVRSLVPGPIAQIDAGMPGLVFAVLGAICLMGAWSAGNAYRRLRRRRMRHSIVGYLALETGGGMLSPEPPSAKAPAPRRSKTRPGAK